MINGFEYLGQGDTALAEDIANALQIRTEAPEMDYLRSFESTFDSASFAVFVEDINIEAEEYSFLILRVGDGKIVLVSDRILEMDDGETFPSEPGDILVYEFQSDTFTQQDLNELQNIVVTAGAGGDEDIDDGSVQLVTILQNGSETKFALYGADSLTFDEEPELLEKPEDAARQKLISKLEKVWAEVLSTNPKPRETVSVNRT